MGNGRRSRSTIAALAVAAMLAFMGSAASARTPRTPSASRERVIFSFSGDSTGEYPDTDLVMDGRGNLYGSTVQGGQYGGGTVFELSPSGNGWTQTVLHEFTGGADGAEPYKGVTLDAQGNIYGTAVTGGAGSCEGGCGVTYELTNSGGTWTEHVLHDFTGGDDGSLPGSAVTLDAAGNVYGMTPDGGAYGMGVIYRLHPTLAGPWAFRVIHPFTGGNDGATGSAGRMIFDADGNLYGVATVGGAHQAGVAFELKQRQAGGWRLKPLYAFKGYPDAGSPYGGLVFDAAGNVYGTTYYDGANHLGAIYELTPRPVGPWKERVIHSFFGGTDGSSSISNLVFDAAGNLYGTTSEGGAAICGGCGVIFKLTPSGGTWTESVAYRFTGQPDGAFAYDGLVFDGAGHFFGATVHGGAGNDGAVYEFTP